jgi:hypothetical protein
VIRDPAGPEDSFSPYSPATEARDLEITDDQYIEILNNEPSLNLYAQCIVSYIAGITVLMIEKSANA